MQQNKSRWRVHYMAGPYRGCQEVDAEDAEQAVAIVRTRVRREMSLVMYAESYKAEEI